MDRIAYSLFAASAIAVTLASLVAGRAGEMTSMAVQAAPIATPAARSIVAARPTALPGATTFLAAPGSPEESQIYQDALSLYRSGHWSAAYGRFIALADRGHANAAVLALEMFRDRTERYGTLWDATPEQVRDWERWSRRADPAVVKVVNR